MVSRRVVKIEQTEHYSELQCWNDQTGEWHVINDGTALVMTIAMEKAIVTTDGRYRVVETLVHSPVVID